MKTEVRRLNPETRWDFMSLRAYPGCDWCFCVAWHVPIWDGWKERTAAENRALRENLFSLGRYDGYLLYVDGRPSGWCQVGPLAWFPKMVGQFGLEGEPEQTPVVGCLEIIPEYRKRGLSRVLLDAALADLGRSGVRRVLAIPRAGRHEDGKVWTGPMALFESRGFKPLREAGERVVMEFLVP